MSALPLLSEAEFAARLGEAGRTLAAGVKARLFAHFEELRRWAARLDLIGPGAGAEIVERHYAESLAALPWLPVHAARLVDLGSGAGFPGLALAAARPDLDVWLIEPRARRAAFLAAAARRMELSVRIVGARVAAPLSNDIPDAIEILTVRALRLEPRAWSALLPRLSTGARLLSWSGERALELPGEFTSGRRMRLEGSERRFLREYLLGAERGAEEAS
jgi:16S rRNA (guanine527-N7)-methyltransferase